MSNAIPALFGVLLCITCGSARAQTAEPATPAYSALPENMQHALLLGEPRSSSQIEDSPFGIVTTICSEGGPAPYLAGAAGVIGAAGYKWVSESMQLSWKPSQVLQLPDAASWSRCREYLARLQGNDVRVLMRLNPLPENVLRGTEQASAADLAQAAAFTRTAVQQLKIYVKHWQIGDDPSSAKSSAAYAKIVAAIRAEQTDAVICLLKRHAGEDGEARAISADGQQLVTPIIDAKNELRRALADVAQGVNPRLHFVFYRNVPNPDFDAAGSFNVVNSRLEKKPLYYAARNLHAVLDSSYKKTDGIHVELSAPNSQVQTYIKRQAGFDELLVFFWSDVPAQNMHPHVPLRMDVGGSTWKAPVLIDLMTLPGQANTTGFQASTHQRTTFPVAHKSQSGVRVEGLELRDYPQLLKLIRPTDTKPQSENAARP